MTTTGYDSDKTNIIPQDWPINCLFKEYLLQYFAWNKDSSDMASPFNLGYYGQQHSQ